MRAPCSVDDMIAALETAKRAGASGTATGWTMEQDQRVPNIQALVVTEEESMVEIAGA